MKDGAGRLTIEDTFAVADSWDEGRSRYRGLRAGGVQIAQVTDDTLIVRPEAAARSSGDSGTIPIPPNNPDIGVGGDETGGTAPVPTPSTPPRPTLFVGSAQLDSLRIGRDAGRIAEEIVQHLSTLPDAEVSVKLEIQIRVRDGIDEATERTVRENSRTLGLAPHFE